MKSNLNKVVLLAIGLSLAACSSTKSKLTPESTTSSHEDTYQTDTAESVDDEASAVKVLPKKTKAKKKAQRRSKKRRS